MRYALLSLSHAFIDIFPIWFVVLVLPLEERLNLSESQVRMVYMATPIFSGLFQPLFAWIGDRFNTRIFSPLGVLIGCLAISSIGLAQSFEQLIALQIVGVIATGFYHPITTALAGQTGARGFKSGRAFAVGLFIAAGMLGQTLSSRLIPEITESFGFKVLLWLIPPGIILAIILHTLTRRIPHRQVDHAESHQSLSPQDRRARWTLVALLTSQNALRFTVNTGIFTLFNIWANSKIPDKDQASILSGGVISAMTLGMGISVITTGRIVKRGKEKSALVAMSFIGAVAIGALGFVGDWAWSHTPEGATSPSFITMLPLYACAALAPIGYFATFPVSASLGQRLVPSHTGIVTSLLMGVGWGISSTHVFLLAWFLGTGIKAAPLEASASEIRIAFVGLASLIILAGIIACLMPRNTIAAVANEH